MKSFRNISIIAMLAVAGSCFAAQAGARQQISDTYAKLDQLTMKLDIDGLGKLLKVVATPDCTFIESTGEKKDVAGAMSSMNQQRAMIAKVKVSSSHIDSLTVTKNKAVAMISSKLAITSAKLQDGKSHEMVENSKSVDTWVNVGGKWKLKLSKTLKQTVTLDGQPVPSAHG